VKQSTKVLRKVRKAAEPAVEVTRDTARAVFKKIKAAHARAARRLR
jgi:hypothetical protein